MARPDRFDQDLQVRHGRVKNIDMPSGCARHGRSLLLLVVGMQRAASVGQSIKCF